MSQENTETVRRVYAERARGNFAAETELFAADAVWTWEVPEGRTVSHGPEEAARNLRAFLDQWEHFRVEADEFIELDERSILVVGRIHGRGKKSGADAEARTFETWIFKGDKVIGQHQSFDRERALEAAGLSESSRSSA
jgi:ketosteroid isomerase-like protein